MTKAMLWISSNGVQFAKELAARSRAVTIEGAPTVINDRARLVVIPNCDFGIDLFSWELNSAGYLIRSTSQKELEEQDEYEMLAARVRIQERLEERVTARGRLLIAAIATLVSLVLMVAYLHISGSEGPAIGILAYGFIAVFAASQGIDKSYRTLKGHAVTQRAEVNQKLRNLKARKGGFSMV